MTTTKPELTYDERSGGIYVYLPNHPRTPGCCVKQDVILLGRGIICDLDENGELIGVEILIPRGDRG